MARTLKSINLLIYVVRWGDRFLDVTYIFVQNEYVKEFMKPLIKLSNSQVLWVNNSKPYIGNAELKISQSLRIGAVIHSGIPQAITLHDMKKQFVFIGIVEEIPHSEQKIIKEQKSKLCEMLINVLALPA